MQRASETIGALAGALAEAQTQLVNPEKSLVATIREDGPEAPLGLHASAKLRERLIAEIEDCVARKCRGMGPPEPPGKGPLAGVLMRHKWRQDSNIGLDCSAALQQPKRQRRGRRWTKRQAEAGLPSEDFRRPPHSKTVDKSVLALPEPRRIRDRDHVRFVAAQPCLVCGRLPSDPHHLRFAQNRAFPQGE